MIRGDVMELQERPSGMDAESARISRFHADLARGILELIRENGFSVGSQLKEQWLSAELGVSRSPVRAALRLLASRGIVKSIPNQGSFLLVPAETIEERVTEIPQTEEEKLYQTITRDRFAQRIDLRINVTELVRRYGTTRSMIGRVLGRLADEGLVERESGRRWSFVPSLDDPGIYDDSYRYRLLIEPAAILGPGFRPDPAQIARLRRVQEDLLAGAIYTAPSRRLVESDADFHQTISTFSGNRFIMQAVQQQTQLRRFMEYQFGGERERMAQSCREHMAIIHALEAGDHQTAADLMRVHITVSRDLRPPFSGAGTAPRPS